LELIFTVDLLFNLLFNFTSFELSTKKRKCFLPPEIKMINLKINQEIDVKNIKNSLISMGNALDGHELKMYQ